MVNASTDAQEGVCVYHVVLYSSMVCMCRITSTKRRDRLVSGVFRWWLVGVQPHDFTDEIFFTM